MHKGSGGRFWWWPRERGGIHADWVSHMTATHNNPWNTLTCATDSNVSHNLWLALHYTLQHIEPLCGTCRCTLFSSQLLSAMLSERRSLHFRIDWLVFFNGHLAYGHHHHRPPPLAAEFSRSNSNITVFHYNARAAPPWHRSMILITVPYQKWHSWLATILTDINGPPVFNHQPKLQSLSL